MHGLGDAWVCSLFRNEGAGLSSELIRAACRATRARWGAPPEGGFLTFIDEPKVKPKRDPGFCFLCAGFEPAGRTKDRGLLVLRLSAEAARAV